MSMKNEKMKNKIDELNNSIIGQKTSIDEIDYFIKSTGIKLENIDPKKLFDFRYLINKDSQKKVINKNSQIEYLIKEYIKSKNAGKSQPSKDSLLASQAIQNEIEVDKMKENIHLQEFRKKWQAQIKNFSNSSFNELWDKHQNKNIFIKEHKSYLQKNIQLLIKAKYEPKIEDFKKFIDVKNFIDSIFGNKYFYTQLFKFNIELAELVLLKNLRWHYLPALTEFIITNNVFIHSHYLNNKTEIESINKYFYKIICPKVIDEEDRTELFKNIETYDSSLFYEYMLLVKLSKLVKPNELAKKLNTKPPTLSNRINKAKKTLNLNK